MTAEDKPARARGQPSDEGMAKESFPFHYGLDADSYTFYRVPKVLFSEPEFSGLSTDARLLYGLLLDRMQLSARNQWVDEYGRVYIYFKVESITAVLGCGNKKACSLLAELDDRKGIGLITRVRQGLGRPDRIYVHKCISEEMSKRHFMRCSNDSSEDVDSALQDMSEAHRNDIEKNNTYINDTESISSYPETDVMDRDGYRKYFERALDIKCLFGSYPMRRETITEIIELLADTCSTSRACIRIAGDDKPAEEVRAVLMSMNDSHIRYVLERLDETGSRIKNIRQYLLTALYNSTMTISNYYEAVVRSDMREGR